MANEWWEQTEGPTIWETVASYVFRMAQIISILLLIYLILFE